MTIFTDGPDVRTPILERYTPSTGTVLSNAFDDALAFSPLASIFRSEDLDIAQEGGVRINTGGARGIQREEPTSGLLTIEEQQSWIEEAGVPLKPEDGLREDSLRLMIEWKKEELARRSVANRSTTGQAVLGFGAGVAGSLFDPLNVAASFVPIVGQARFAAAAARAASPIGRAGVRSSQGFIAGAQGALLVEPIVYAQAEDQQADYTAYNSLMNVAFGAFLGAGLHAGTGAVGDAIGITRASRSRAEMEARAQIFSDDVALAVSDKNPVGVFRVADLMTDPKLADAGLKDAGGVGTAPRMHYDMTTVEIPRGVPVETVNARARNSDPDTFTRLDEISQELETIRGQTPVEAQRTADGQAAIDRYEHLQTLRDTKDRRIQRRLDKQEAQALARLDALGFPTKIPQAKAAITRSKKKGQVATSTTRALESEQKSLRVKADRALQKTLKALKSERHVDTRTTVNGIDVEELAKFSDSTANSRLVDFRVLDERIEQFADDIPKDLDATTAQAELTDAMTRITELKKQLGEDNPQMIKAADNVLTEADETIKLAEEHHDALSAAFACRIR